MKGRVHSIETFGTVDGPGIRYVLFLQGCPFRCKYCHNPDTWDYVGASTEYDAEQIAKDVLRYRNYYEDGGITVSGGEPLVQIDFVIELFTLLKAKGIHTAVDTCGYTFDKDNPMVVEKFDRLIEVADLFLLDIKHIDDMKHIDLTGKSNKHTLDFARYLSDHGKHMWIRHVLVEGYTDDDIYLKRTKTFVDTLNCVDKIEVLPYHTMGRVKYQKLGIPYALEGVEPPTRDRVINARTILGVKKNESNS